MRSRRFVSLIVLKIFLLCITGTPLQMSAEPALAADANAWGADGYFDLHFYDSVHVSPDVGSVVFEVSKPNIAGEANEWQQQIVLVDMDGETKALTDMENAGVDSMSPQWSPDGALISFIALGRRINSSWSLAWNMKSMFGLRLQNQGSGTQNSPFTSVIFC